MSEHAVVLHSRGPAWDPGVGFRDQEGIGEHVAYWRSVAALYAGGPFVDDSGGMMIVAASLDEARAHADADPAVRSGLLRHEVKPWRMVFSPSIAG